MNAAPLDQFIALSAVLTGFAASDIGDPLDPDKLASLYFGVLTKDIDAGPILAAFAEAQRDSAGNAEALVDAVAARICKDATLGPLARSIMKLWYLGKWQDAFVSEAAYLRALAWPAMDAKAIGDSGFVNQNWKDAPAAANAP